jgi:hypothetical protein
LAGTDGFDLQLPTAMGAEFKRQWPSSGLEKARQVSGLFE